MYTAALLALVLLVFPFLYYVAEGSGRTRTCGSARTRSAAGRRAGCRRFGRCGRAA